MPQNIAIKLQTADDFSPDHNFGEQLHGLVLKLIAEQDAALATKLHDDNAPKAFTVSGPRSRKIDSERTYWVRMTTLADDVGLALLNAVDTAIRGRGELRLGAKRVIFEEFSPDELPEQLSTHYVSYDKLWTEASEDKFIKLEFSSPTAFNFSGTNKLLPDASLCFKHYLRQWTNFDAKERLNDKATIQAIISGVKAGVRLADVIAASKVSKAKGQTLPGFVGRVKFDISGCDAELRRTLNALADLAFYCGTGYKTTMGMGQTIRVR